MQAHAQAHGMRTGYHISTPLLCKCALKISALIRSTLLFEWLHADTMDSGSQRKTVLQVAKYACLNKPELTFLLMP